MRAVSLIVLSLAASFGLATAAVAEDAKVPAKPAAAKAAAKPAPKAEAAKPAASATKPAAAKTAKKAKPADCRIIAAAGNGPTEDIGRVMSTNGLKNIIDSKGLTGQGPVQTKCGPGALGTIECRSQQRACK